MNNDEQAIRETVNLYFTGTYYGNIAHLKQAFHPEARIAGYVNNDLYDWSLTEFITRITDMPTAASREEKFDKNILSLDQHGNAATVKAQVFVGPYILTDYITLLKIKNRWVIRHKSFST